jgi:large subunit ribosomal protein L9
VKVVLRTDVAGLGRKGDIHTVAEGYARNYLFPKGLALAATPGIEKQAEAMRKARLLRSAADRAGAEQLAELLRVSPIRITAKAGREGKLFGSVSAADIVAAVATQAGTQLERRQVELAEPIKALGSHHVLVRLHSDVEVTLTVDVVAS